MGSSSEQRRYIVTLLSLAVLAHTVLEIRACPRPTTFEEDRELFVDFSSSLCLRFD